MTSGRRDDDPAAPPDGSAAGDGELLTSEDLFGDMLDEPRPTRPPPPSPPRPAHAAKAPPAGQPARRGPIKVQVGEPGAARKVTPLATRAAGEALPADVAALLDAFSEPAEAVARKDAARPLPEAKPAAAAPPAPPRPPPPAPAPAVAEEDPLLSIFTPAAAHPAPSFDDLDLPDVPAPPSAEPQRADPAPVAARLEADDEPAPLAGMLADRAEDDLDLVAASDEPALPEPPPPRREPAPERFASEPLPPPPPAAKKRSPDLDQSVRDLLNLRPAARTATKFQAAAPKKTLVAEGEGIDLLGLATEAFSVAPEAPAVPAPSPPKTEPLAVPRSAPAGQEDAYGPYRLLERVAVGGMAEVFRAKRSGVEGFEKVVAVKRILPHLSDNKEFVDMFIDEAKMVASLTHPNIVQIFDLGKIQKSYYIAMEYVHGRDLRSILRRAKERGLRVPLDLSAFIVSRMCSALEYAHRKRDESGRPMLLVHRDISPQNILISFEGDVKLTDFGIAKAATKATVTDRGALRGKLLYMSPEQAWGKSMDRRGDIFSLGIVLYEMLTDHKPFLGSSEMSILEMVRECRVAPPTDLNPRIPEKMERVVMKALEKDPELRYQDAGEMHRDLERVLHERQAPTPRDLTRFLELLFDEKERGDPGSGEWHGDRGSGTPSSLEVEFDHDAAEPGDRTPGAEVAPAADAAGKDAMNIQKLLKRFGIK